MIGAAKEKHRATRFFGRRRGSLRMRAGFSITYECSAPTAAVLQLSVHPSRRRDLITPDTMRTNRDVMRNEYVDGFGNICTRVMLAPGSTTFMSDFKISDNGLSDEVKPTARLTPIEALPDDVMVYLLGSRYCETDRMSALAWSLFGATEPGWPRVQAIVDYTHQRLQFGYPHARATRTAWEAHEERVGVCRDFAHLAVTLCRCMSVPARYCTGYLGDIGAPKVDAPMDFSAWFEVFLDGAWRTFDARHNTPRIGRVLIARGRDATDTAIATTYGEATLTKFEVTTLEL